ncbi:hypothetical protein [Streptomyces sp. NPDC001100]
MKLVPIDVGGGAGTRFFPDRRLDVVDGPSGLGAGHRGREGDVEGGMWWAGQAQGLIDSVESCETVVRTIVADAESIIRDRLRHQLVASDDMAPAAAC